jgi:hypothetical protein
MRHLYCRDLLGAASWGEMLAYGVASAKHGSNNSWASRLLLQVVVQKSTRTVHVDGEFNLCKPPLTVTSAVGPKLLSIL